MRYLRLTFLLGAVFLGATALDAQRAELIYAFSNYSSVRPTQMILVGEIQSKTKVAEATDRDSPFPGYDMRLDQVTVKVQNRRGLQVGQKLYVIDKDPFHQRFRNGLIVGEIEVTSILYSPFYGWVLTGKGILLRVREGQFVARTLETENLERAYALKKRGDHYRNRGDYERAILSYNEALSADRALPEASAALGDLYFRMALDSPVGETPVRALSEYARAWTNRGNFRYAYEEQSFYHNYMNALFYMYSTRRRETSREANLASHLDRIIEVGAAAARAGRSGPELKIQLARAQFYRSEYYAREATPAERRLRDEADEATAKLLKELLDGGVRDSVLYSVAMQYYGARYLELRAKARRTATEEEYLNQLDGLVQRLVPLYRQYSEGRREPEVDRILDRLR